MENNRLKLSYFDARGVAETTRYMLAVTKTPYEDFRYGPGFALPEISAPCSPSSAPPRRQRTRREPRPPAAARGRRRSAKQDDERFEAERVGMIATRSQIDSV